MIKKHGNKQIEFSQYFEISKGTPRVEYNIDIWFFIPSSLNTRDYNSEDFFTDFTSYTRYNAPNLSLSALNDFFNPKNPITRIQNTHHNTENFNEIEYELKSLLNIFKLSCSRTIITLKTMNKLSGYESDKNLSIQMEKLKNIQLKLLSLSRVAPEEFCSIYNLALEGISLRIEKSFQNLYRTFMDSREILLQEMEYQRTLRENLGFKTIITEDEKVNSETIYREHIIKKWSESIMYINMENSKTQKGINHLFLGSAAALAMLITGIITIVVVKIWGSDNLYWFIAVLLLYSLKDRIKDIFKASFSKRMSSIFSDRAKSIISPINRRKCGKSRESVTFPEYKNMNSDLQKLRFYLKNDISIKQNQEDIVHYNKQVKIFTSKLYRNHTRLFGIREIMRLDLRKWFHKMDKDIEKCYMPQNGTLIQVNGDREYHFNVILKVNSPGTSFLKRYRVVANSRKIKSVEKIT